MAYQGSPGRRPRRPPNATDVINIQHDLMQELKTFLDPDHPEGKDWRMLACKLGIENPQINVSTKFNFLIILDIWGPCGHQNVNISSAKYINANFIS